MGKKLAIKGHPTRGKEVIELLEMLGGINDREYSGTNTWKDEYYFLDNGYIRAYDWCDGIKLTLEEFLEEYPYKVGDKVNSPCKGCIKTITSMKWDECLNTVSYKLDDKIYTTIEQLKVVNDSPYKETDDIKHSDSKCERTREDVIFDSIIWHLRNSVNNGKQHLSGGECEKYFREVVKANNENKMKNVIAELFEHIKTTPKKELEREFNELEEWSHVGPTVEEFMDFCNKVNKKSKYPKTYAECCEVLVGRKPNPNEIPFDKMELCLVDLDNTQSIFFQVPHLSQLNALFRLLMCYKAYRKIAGDEMGLGKPWEPDLQNEELYCIQNYNKQIIKSKTNTAFNKILIFPSEEMRDVFYANFNDLIEECKELL